jgi:hypothetical protein
MLPYFSGGTIMLLLEGCQRHGPPMSGMNEIDQNEHLLSQILSITTLSQVGYVIDV